MVRMRVIFLVRFYEGRIRGVLTVNVKKNWPVLAVGCLLLCFYKKYSTVTNFPFENDSGYDGILTQLVTLCGISCEYGHRLRRVQEPRSIISRQGRLSNNSCTLDGRRSSDL